MIVYFLLVLGFIYSLVVISGCFEFELLYVSISSHIKFNQMKQKIVFSTESKQQN